MDGAGAAAAPFAPMPSSGSSSSWKAQKNNVLRIVGLMLAVINTSANHPSKGLYPDSFDAFTAAQASNEDVYALFATFVAKEYVTGRAGAFLSPDVAVNYLRTFVQIDNRQRLCSPGCNKTCAGCNRTCAGCNRTCARCGLHRISKRRPC